MLVRGVMVVCHFVCVKSVIVIRKKAQVSQLHDTVNGRHFFFFATDPIFHCTCSECIEIFQLGADSAPLQKPTVMCSSFYLPLSTSHVCPVLLLRCFHQSLTFLP